MRIPITLLSALALGASFPALAQDGAAATPKADATSVTALLAEFAKSDVPYPKRHAHFQDRFEALAKKHRGSEDGLTAELWLLSGSWWLQDAEAIHKQAGAVADRILEYSFHSKRLGELLRQTHVLSNEQMERIFGKVLKVTKFPEIKAAAHLALGELFLATDRRKEGEKHLRILQDKFPGIPYRGSRFGALAEALLAPEQEFSLEFGKPAPEIVGVSIHGEPMRLSDYRGKIVVLDFWGDW